MIAFRHTVKAAWRPLYRSLDGRSVVTEILTLAAGSLLAALLVVFGMRIPYDNASFILGMDYDRSSEATVAGLRVTIAEDALYAAASSTHPTGGSTLGDGERARPVAVGIYSPDDSMSVSRLLRASPLKPGEVIVDEATVHGLGIAIGDPIVLLQPGDELRECILAVSDTVAPYHPKDDLGAGGLVVMAEGECGAHITNPTMDASRSTTHCFDCAPTPEDHSRWETAVRASVGFDNSPFATVALALIGIALWILATRRALGRVKAMAFDSWLTLTAMGASPRTTLAMVQVAWIAGVSVASVLGSYGASVLMTRVAQLYVQIDMIAAVAGVLIMVAYLTRPRGAPSVRPEGSDHDE